MRLLLNIDVDDLAGAERFYCAAFGLTPARRLGSEVLELAGAEVPVFLLCNAAGSAAVGDTRRDYRRHWTPLHCDVVVEDVEAALDRARAAGARQEGEIRSAAYGRIVQLADPYGHGWCLIQFQGRGYDEIAAPPAPAAE
ncbi:VOC family protein [Luteimonas sp. RD2P54]|uniref:VOC family protein n=1 Tax=Luteimonas endophytica TaxID=3042023 RepID=A0ABT6J8R1_9GAMM|nr:VOC family protein [Luteimonas endophytica]MDH5823203.1 VOC family protein [Luteimonas endophytica]